MNRDKLEKAEAAAREFLRRMEAVHKQMNLQEMPDHSPVCVESGDLRKQAIELTRALEGLRHRVVSEQPQLQPCPCGEVPDRLDIISHGSAKWAWVYGACCSEWHIEFRTNYHPLESDECAELAEQAWNDSPRAV